MDDQGQVEYAFEYQYSAAHNRTVKIENGTPTYYTYNANSGNSGDTIPISRIRGTLYLFPG